MAEWTDRITEPISEVTQALTRLVDLVLSETDQNFLVETVPDSILQDKVSYLVSLWEAAKFDYKIDDSILSDGNDQSEKVAAFNSEINSKVHEVVVGSNKSDNTDQQSNKIQFKGYELSEIDLEFFNRISVVLDVLVFLVLNGHEFTKQILYDSLSRISRFLLSISTSQVDIFWWYLESRELLFQERVFDRTATSDRIAVLDLCNSLTDKFIFKDSRGKSDTYKKDSFNDKFQYRVRVFITNIFAFEDNTGLNKYFHIANRSIYEVKTKSQFVEDLMAIEKLFNDPYYYLKKSNSKELSRLMDRLINVYEYIKEMELDFQKKLRIDQFLVPEPRSEADKEYLSKKYSRVLYFPEAYFKSAFTVGNKSSHELQVEDREFFTDQFETSSIRLQYLVKIFIIANLYFELIPRNKDDFIKSIGAPTNVKHITDDSVPDVHKGVLYKIKKDMFASFKSVDTAFSFLIQHITVGETFWWSWLIYGKDHTGKPLFADRQVAKEELQEVKEKSEKLFPYKNKKYFNTYVTPSATRMMKVQRDMKKLAHRQDTEESISHIDQSFAAITSNIEDEFNPVKKEELLEKRNSLIWKRLKLQRRTRWLQFGSLLTKEMLDEGKEEEVVEEQNGDVDVKEERGEEVKEQKEEQKEEVGEEPNEDVQDDVQVDMNDDEVEHEEVMEDQDNGTEKVEVNTVIAVKEDDESASKKRAREVEENEEIESDPKKQKV
ncbi:hypothetical protein G9P44_001368 [Scheffersomyces stipitis]|nr:hypothetical protein G9P44_001368 [Scheffersomyces stipitis]